MEGRKERRNERGMTNGSKEVKQQRSNYRWEGERMAGRQFKKRIKEEGKGRWVQEKDT